MLLLTNRQFLFNIISKLLVCDSPSMLLQSNEKEAKALKALLTIITNEYSGKDNQEVAYDLHKTLNIIYDYRLFVTLYAKSTDKMPR